MKTRKAETAYQPKCTEVLTNGTVCGNTHLLSDSKCAVHWKHPTPATAGRHTPTSWKIVTGPGAVDIADTSDTCVARCLSFNGLSQKQAQANAAFIVRAVNAHEELLDLVKELYGYCGSRLNNDACIRVEEAITHASQTGGK